MAGNKFDKRWVFVPVHGMGHWSLAIVCTLSCGAVVILHLDSLRDHHKTCMLQPLAKFLDARPGQRPGQRKVHVLRLAHTPRQRNKCDCGFFMLKAIELFCEALCSGEALLNEAVLLDLATRKGPKKYEPALVNRPGFLGTTWFGAQEAAALRGVIRDKAIAMVYS